MSNATFTGFKNNFAAVQGNAAGTVFQNEAGNSAIYISQPFSNVPFLESGDFPTDNPWLPGDPKDPSRPAVQVAPPADGGYYASNLPHWGVDNDGHPLLRVFESALIDKGADAWKCDTQAAGTFEVVSQHGLSSLDVNIDGISYSLLESGKTEIQLAGGKLVLYAEVKEAPEPPAPVSPTVDISTHIMLDESALANGSGQHEAGGQEYSGEFTVDLHGEAGTITLSYGDRELAFDIPENNEGEIVIPKDEDGQNAVLNVMGAAGISITNASFNADGKVIVEYTAVLNDALQHGEPGSDNDDILADAITVKVASASGDVIKDKLNLEVRDDKPVLENIVFNEDPDRPTESNSNSVCYDFGADDGDSPLKKVTVEKNGEIVVWEDNNDPANKTTDISRMKPGDVWTDGEITVTMDSNQVNSNKVKTVTFDYATHTDPEYTDQIPLKITIVDSDGDTNDTIVVLNDPVIFDAPNIVNPPLEPERPDDPQNPGGDPNNPWDENYIKTTGKAHIVVDEGAIMTASGKPSGNHNAHGSSGNGSFIVQMPEGEGRITLTGKDVNGNTLTSILDIAADGIRWDGNGNVFHANGVNIMLDFDRCVTKVENGSWKVAYEYELTGAQVHNKAEGNNSIILDEAVQIGLADSTGQWVGSAIKVEVHDDVPIITAINPSTALSGAITGFYGADGAAAGNLGIQIKTASGAVCQAASASDNTFSFELDDGDKLKITDNRDGTFSYDYTPDDYSFSFKKSYDVVLTDGDGDEAQATLDINYTSTTGDVIVDDGKRANDLTGYADQNVALANSLLALLSDAEQLELAARAGESGASQSVVAVNYIFTLDEAVQHRPDAQAINSLDQLLNLHAVDKMGAEQDFGLHVQIVDDTPDPRDDVAELSANADSVSGNVLANDGVCADALAPGIAWFDAAGNALADDKMATGAKIRLEHGFLQAKADGSWLYELNASDAAVQALGKGDKLSETVRYVVADTDGDAAEATLSINIIGEENAPVIPSLVFDEKNLYDGTDPNQVPLVKNGSLPLNLPNGLKSWTIVHEGQSYAIAQDNYTNISVDNGVFSAWRTDSDSLSYSFILSNPAFQTQTDQARLVFEAILEDNSGAVYAGNLIYVDIIDDKPVYQNGKIWNISPNANAARGNAFDCFMPGADDPGAFEWLADENTLAAIRKYGQLELYADGNYTFTPASSSGQPDAVLVLPFGYADADGDAISGAITFNMNLF